MDKRRVIQCLLILIIAVVLAVVIVTLYRSNHGEDTIVENKPLNSKVDLNIVFEEIVKLDGAGFPKDIDDEMNNENESNSSEGEVNDNKQNSTAPEDEIDFGKFDVLEKKAIVNTTDEQVNEVWMVKLGNYDQQEEVCRVFGNRLQKLRNGFAENAQQLNIINDAVIKQEGAIVIMIASPMRREIEQKISEVMDEME